MNRSFDPLVFKTAVADHPEFDLPDETLDEWLADDRNLMFDEDGSVGLLTHEYPGVYSAHWFFKVRGREALSLAKRMLGEVFDNHDGKVVRGLTEVNLRAARWAARQVGMKSYGIMSYPDGDYELFCMTKQEFER